MKCPKCGKDGCKYDEQRKKSGSSYHNLMKPRTNFNAKCKYCGWEGKA